VATSRTRCCSGGAVQRIAESALDELSRGRTRIPLSAEATGADRIRHLSVAELLAENHPPQSATRNSVSSLYCRLKFFPGMPVWSRTGSVESLLETK